MTEACIIIHAKTPQELETMYNNLRRNLPDLDVTGKSFQVSDKGFSLAVFHNSKERVKA